MPRGHARQPPPLRARYRRRQPALVRSRTTRRGTRWGGVVAPPSFLFATSRIISGYVGGLPGVHAMWAGRGLDVAPPGAAQRRDHDRGVAQGADRAPDDVRGPLDPAGLSRRLPQPARRPRRRRRQLVLSHRSRPGARSRDQVHRGEGEASEALHRRGARRTSTGSTRTRRSAAAPRGTGTTCARASGCRRWRRGR
mgnify:CR=1 FL=1